MKKLLVRQLVDEMPASEALPPNERVHETLGICAWTPTISMEAKTRVSAVLMA
jgi:hypothetical protein